MNAVKILIFFAMLASPSIFIGQTISIQVFDHKSQLPVKGAEVFVFDEQEPKKSYGKTDAKGNIEISLFHKGYEVGQKLKFYFSHSEFVDYEFTHFLSSLSNKNRVKIFLQNNFLPTPTTIVGNVFDQDISPLKGVKVYLSSGDNVWSATTSRNGNFKIKASLVVGDQVNVVFSHRNFRENEMEVEVTGKVLYLNNTELQTL